MPDAVAAFASDVGPVDAGAVVAVGGRTHFEVGGRVDAAAREVTAPGGIVAHEPAEMTVRVRAGTTVAELDAALADAGQCVALPVRSPASTVGGVLAVGRSGLRRLGWGPVRDAVLEVTAVTGDGRLVRAGGPTVKNVTGYDLCRLLVGSLGTLAVIVEVVLRTRPLPVFEGWFTGTPPPSHRPLAALWDGETTTVLLAGHPADVEAAGLMPVDGPPDLDPLPHRWSLPVADLAALRGDGHGPFVAELGVGVVHRALAQPRRPVDPAVRTVHERLKSLFDPAGRLAPGRSVLAA
jgi:glycolate oxidase FAD binding subunit